MYNWHYDESNDFVKDIEYVKGLYESQVNKVKQEEYIKGLLFADYVGKVKRHQSRYDFIEDVIKEAQSQIGKKKKKEREQLSVLEEFIRHDFFNNNNSFKITEIMSGGYESYYWSIELEGYGQTVRVQIPNMNSINTTNFEYAYNGMFTFVVKESDSSWAVKEKSYEIEDISECIKAYFRLDEVDT